MASSRNVLPGLECVGPLKVVDTVATTRLDISTGSMKLLPEPGLGISLDEAKLKQYRPQAHSLDTHFNACYDLQTHDA